MTHTLAQASGFRHGIVSPWQEVPPTGADLPGLHNVFVPSGPTSEEHAVAGGFGRTLADASCAAIAEALERYAAHMARFEVRRGRDIEGPILDARDFSLFSDEQRAQSGFPYPYAHREEARYAEVFAIDDNRSQWVPEELVGLGSREEQPLLPSTSTGLAAAADPMSALLSAVEELLERDALTVSWLASLGGREIDIPAERRAPVIERGGEIRAFDLTQSWNPHPVVVVMGQLPLRGTKRYSMGAACRFNHEMALEKAWLEWVQGVVFAGHYARENPRLRFERPTDIRTFPEHGVYHTLFPDRWHHIPLLAWSRPFQPPRPVPEALPHASDRLDRLRRSLGEAGIRLFYRELTLPDVRDVGLFVVRALSPDLALLHGDERFPFLGGRTRDVAWRYPDVDPAEVRFVNPHPHPLG